MSMSLRPLTRLSMSVTTLAAIAVSLSSRPVSGQTGCVPPPPGLVSWWSGEGNANDTAGANNGILEGNVTYGQGEVGQAFVFDGVSSGIVVGNDPSLQLQDLTIEAW